MGRDIVVLGAGGLGREVLCLIRDINRAFPGTWNFLGFVAGEPPDPASLGRISARYLGSDRDEHVLREIEGACFVAAIGKPEIRRLAYEHCIYSGLSPAKLVHPTAIVGEDVQMRDGVVICAGSIITTNVRIGMGVQIDRMCTVGHDCVIGDFVTLTPRVTLSGGVTVGSAAYMGTGSTTVQNLVIGESAVIGAGALVAGDIAPRVTAYGVPARART